MRKIGKYEVIEEIGSGGMGTVYQARHPGLGKIVAIKVLSSECTEDVDLVARFEREARIMAALPDYRHVVQVFDAGKDGERYWYAMEYIPVSLADYLGEPDAEKTRVSSPRTIDVKTTVDIAFQVLSGLEVIHASGVIHRDLCPQNIVLKTEHPEPIVKITDFGIGGKLTKIVMWGGHGFYAAPEPWSESGPHSDIYSLAVLMYRMVTGRNPAGRFKDPGVLNKGVGPVLNDCIIKCMEQDPEDRYQSADEMRGALAQIRRGKELPSGRRAAAPSANTPVQEKPAAADSTSQKKKEKKTSDDKKFSVSDPAKRITNSIGMEFVYIEPGTFMMGRPEDEPGWGSNETLHKVNLSKGFYMQTTQVTQAHWKAVMGANPSSFKGDDLPVEEVSWCDAQKFIQKLIHKEKTDKYRLPTEAEWEYACRAGTTTPFYFGRCLGTDQANYNGNYPLEGCPKGKNRKKTTPVKMFSPNAWGLYDMHGNVWEWCADWFGEYESSVVTDPIGRSLGRHRVVRGGSWYNDADSCRSAYRGNSSPRGRSGRRPCDLWGTRYNIFGFRLVLLPGH